MTHYTHKHTVKVTGRCAPCDCYVCNLLDERPGVRRRHWSWTILAVERVHEEIEAQLTETGDTSVMRVWNALTGWTPKHQDVSPDSAVGRGQVMITRPSLLGVVRGVFRSLDRHEILRPKHWDKNMRRVLAWQEATRS